jgi:hypothetical protein
MRMAVTILPAGTVDDPVVDLGAFIAVGLWVEEDLTIDFFEIAIGVASRLDWMVRFTALHSASCMPNFGVSAIFLDVLDK